MEIEEIYDEKLDEYYEIYRCTIPGCKYEYKSYEKVSQKFLVINKIFTVKYVESISELDNFYKENLYICPKCGGIQIRI